MDRSTLQLPFEMDRRLLRTTAISMDTRTIQVRIEGQVQCVGFRAFVEMNAIDLGLEGWVPQSPGRISRSGVSRYGGAVEIMLQRCQAGPPASAVTGVKLLGEGAGSFNGFSVRRTV